MRGTKVLSRKYYKNRTWKITSQICPTCLHPYAVRDGYRLVKFYEKRNGVGTGQDSQDGFSRILSILLILSE